MAQSKGNGAGVGDFVTGSLIEKHNIKAILVDTGGDLRSEDDASRERALQFIQPLMYEIQNAGNGLIFAVVDGSQFDAAALQAQLRGIGTDNVNGYNFSSATVTAGSNITVS